MHSVKEYPTQDRTGYAPPEGPHPSHGWHQQGHGIGAQVDIAQYRGYYATGHRERRSNRDDKVKYKGEQVSDQQIIKKL